jgi:hypothetical protein
MSARNRELLKLLCAKVSEYEHSYGQARDEALADYGNTFSKVLAQLSEPEWLPIETAPKDGTEIVCLDSYLGSRWTYTAEWNGICWYHGLGDAYPKGNPSHWSPVPKDTPLPKR